MLLFDDIAFLLSDTVTQDEIGNEIISTADVEVYVNVNSVSQSEFHSAGQTGLKPQHKFVMKNVDYSGEKLIKYNDIVYDIYRTYLSKDNIELYTTLRVGNG